MMAMCFIKARKECQPTLQIKMPRARERAIDLSKHSMNHAEFRTTDASIAGYINNMEARVAKNRIVHQSYREKEEIDG